MYSFQRASLLITSITRCTVTFTCNTVTSSTATVNIDPTTAIVTPPVGAAVCSKIGNYTFSVGANGFELSYQWYRNGSVISGANSSTYTVKPLDPFINTITNYAVRVAGHCGGPFLANASLTVLPSSTPALTFQPLTKTVSIHLSLSSSQSPFPPPIFQK